jgi:hypothetical protein
MKKRAASALDNEIVLGNNKTTSGQRKSIKVQQYVQCVAHRTGTLAVLF